MPNIRKLSDELQEVAIKELNEDPNRIESDLNYIKEWLSKQPHLKARTDDQFLIAFLRGTKYSLERTKEKLDMHYTLKTITPELFANRDPFDPEVQKILSAGAFLPLPASHPGGPRHALARNGIMEKKKLDHYAMMKVNTMFQDILLLEDDNLGVAGIAMVQDMDESTLGFIKGLPLSLMKKATTVFQNGYPHRIKGMHAVNASTIFDAMYAIVKPFLNEKMRKRLQVHSTFEDLYKVIPQHVLPKEYGGTAGTLDELTAYWKKKVEQYKDWFVEDEQYRTDEKKRPGRPKTSESVFGLEGSFRQLSVD